MKSEDNATTAPHVATQQEKLDAIFGITGGKTLDDFLDTLSLDQSKIEDTMSSIDQSVKQYAQDIEEVAKDDQNEPELNIVSMNHSLSQIEELVSLSKSVIKHVADSILATPLIDSEAVQAYSALMQSIANSISEFVTVYRDKQLFINKVKLSCLQHQQEKDLILYKHNLALERIKAKEAPKDVTGEADVTNVVWNQEKITKLINGNSCLMENV